MTNRLKNSFVFLASLVLAGGVYAWFYPLNRGDLIISAGLSDYFVLIGNDSIQCEKDPCTTSLNTGSHSIKVQKDGYSPHSFEANIKRGKTNEFRTELKKIPNLIVSPIIPIGREREIIKDIPEAMKGISILAPKWNQNNELAYIDQGDNKLKIWSETKAVKTITSLKNLSEEFELHWSPNSNHLIGTLDQDIYLINIQKASRLKQILDFKPKNITWSLKEDYILLNNDKNDLYKIDPNGKLESMKIQLNLQNSAWETESSLILYRKDDQFEQIEIEGFNLATNEKIEILTKYNFPITEISSNADGKIYFYQSNQENWYYLEY